MTTCVSSRLSRPDAILTLTAGSKLKPMNSAVSDSDPDSEDSIQRKKLRSLAAAKRGLDKLVGSDVEPDIREFLYGYWRNLLAAIWLRRGPESPQWTQALHTVKVLLWSLNPDSVHKNRGEWLKTVAKLQKAVLHALQSLSVDSEESARIMKMLALYHGYLLKAGSPSNDMVEDDIEIDMEEDEGDSTFKQSRTASNDPALQAFIERESSRFSHQSDAPQSAEEIQAMFNSTIDMHLKKTPKSSVQSGVSPEYVNDLDDFDALVRASQYQVPEKPVDTGSRTPVKPGSWVNMLIQEQEVLVKLAMINKVTGMYIFVNRKGHKVKEMTEAGVVHALESGTIKLAQGGLKSSSIR